MQERKALFGDVQAGLTRLSAGTVDSHDIWRVVHTDVKTSSRVRAVMEFLTQLMASEEPLLSGARPRVSPKQAKAKKREARAESSRQLENVRRRCSVPGSLRPSAKAARGN